MILQKDNTNFNTKILYPNPNPYLTTDIQRIKISYIIQIHQDHGKYEFLEDAYSIVRETFI